MEPMRAPPAESPANLSKQTRGVGGLPLITKELEELGFESGFSSAPKSVSLLLLSMFVLEFGVSAIALSLSLTLTLHTLSASS